MTSIGAVGPVGVTETSGPAAPALFMYVPGVRETVTSKVQGLRAHGGNGKRPAPAQRLADNDRVVCRRTSRRAGDVGEPAGSSSLIVVSVAGWALGFEIVTV